MATAREIARILGRGEQLTRQEEEELAAYLAINDITRAWVKDGTGIPYFTQFEAEKAFMLFNPNEPLWLFRKNNQAIQNGVSTPIEFDVLEINQGAHLWSESNPSKIFWKGQPKKNAMMVGGYVHFEGNNAGERIIFLNEYDRLDSLISGGTVGRFPAVTADPLAIPFISIRQPVAQSSYIQLEIEQNSGVDLNVTYADLAIVRVY